MRLPARSALTLLASALLRASAFADDTYFTMSGGAPGTLGAEHPTVAMAEEYVKVTVGTETYTVHATFEFTNDGPSTSVLVAFPVTASSVPGFLSFRTWVNGVETPAERVPKDTPPIVEDGDTRYWMVKHVDFPSGAVTTTAVEYTAELSGDSLGGKDLSYIYGTGRTWAGPIGRALFDFRFDEDLSLKYYDRCPAAPVMTRSRGQLVFELRDVEPKDDDASIAFQFHPQPFLEENEFWNGRPEQEPALDFLREGGCKRDWRLQSLRQLRLMRNRIFALHGRHFDDPALQSFFSVRPWYGLVADKPVSGEESALSREIQRLEDDIRKTPRFEWKR